MVTARAPTSALAALLQHVLPAESPVYLMYPAPQATDVTHVDVAVDARGGGEDGERGRSGTGGRGYGVTPDDMAGGAAVAAGEVAAAAAAMPAAAAALRGAAYACVVIDGTWGQAREMVGPVAARLPARMKVVQLPRLPPLEPPPTPTFALDALGDAKAEPHADQTPTPAPAGASTPEPALWSVDRGASGFLMLEPAPGCMLTAEAAARAVWALERSCAAVSTHVSAPAPGTTPGPRVAAGDGCNAENAENAGDAVLAAVLRSVGAMLRFQAAHDPAMRAPKRNGGGRRQRLGDFGGVAAAVAAAQHPSTGGERRIR